MTATDFAPITLNGEPVITWRMTHLIELDGRLYESEYAASEDCLCRRCSLHEDFGGCLVAEAQWGLVTLLTAPIPRRCNVCYGCRNGYPCERTGAR